MFCWSLVVLHHQFLWQEKMRMMRTMWKQKMRMTKQGLQLLMLCSGTRGTTSKSLWWLATAHWRLVSTNCSNMFQAIIYIKWPLCFNCIWYSTFSLNLGRQVSVQIVQFGKCSPSRLSQSPLSSNQALSMDPGRGIILRFLWHRRRRGMCTGNPSCGNAGLCHRCQCLGGAFD